MRFTLEPSPAGGFNVWLEGVAAPLSHHDTASLLTGNRSMLRLFERLGAVRTRGHEAGVLEIDVELPLDDAKTLLRTAATGHVRSIPARD